MYTYSPIPYVFNHQWVLSTSPHLQLNWSPDSSSSGPVTSALTTRFPICLGTFKPWKSGSSSWKNVDLTIEHRDLVEFEASMTIQNWDFIWFHRQQWGLSMFELGNWVCNPSIYACFVWKRGTPQNPPFKVNIVIIYYYLPYFRTNLNVKKATENSGVPQLEFGISGLPVWTGDTTHGVQLISVDQM